MAVEMAVGTFITAIVYAVVSKLAKFAVDLPYIFSLWRAYGIFKGIYRRFLRQFYGRRTILLHNHRNIYRRSEVGWVKAANICE